MSNLKLGSTAVLSLQERMVVWAQLMKFRLTFFVVLSAVLGYFIGAEVYNVTKIFWLIIGGFMITGSSNIFNQILERDTDKLMERTKNRPLVISKIAVSEAIWAAALLAVSGVAILWLSLNPLSGILGMLAIFIYVVLYTPLKRISTSGVFVGAFPGAIPPMLGCVAATGTFSLEAGILFALQFMWQFPHFWAIAWKLDKDYKKASLKMLPFNKKNGVSAMIILVSALVLFGASFLPEYFGITGRWTTIGLLILSTMMLYPSVMLLWKREDKYALRIMFMSYFYLIFSLIIIMIDKI